MSGCAYHVAGVLTIWQACVQCCAGTRERVCLPFGRRCAQRCAAARGRACLPFGRRVRSAAREHVSGCAYHVAGVCTALRGCA